MVTLYVEGGGDTATLKKACREGFQKFMINAKICKRPRAVACGSRHNAYESFCTAISNGQEALLLVDSEGPVQAAHQQGQAKDQWQPWRHLKNRPDDDWNQPEDAADTDCHLMVQVMESWLLYDRDTLKDFFGQGFRESALPSAANPVENIAKDDVYQALKQSTQNCNTKVPYQKGKHSFKLLARIDPVKVANASPWTKRFIDELKKKMDC